MRKKDMLKILDAVNQNRNIKWNILENTGAKIVVTNDYDTSIRFEITMGQGPGERDIRIRDEGNLPDSVGYLIQGAQSWADFIEPDDGISKALMMINRFFYYYY